MGPGSTTSEGAIHVLTFKDGVLSRLGHDLRFRIDRFQLSVGDGEILGNFETTSMRLEGAMRDGELQSGSLSSKDSRDISNNVRDKVLHTRRYPHARLRAHVVASEAEVLRVTGQLELLGVSREIMFSARRSGGWVEGQVVLVPSRWGIEPFKALLGALRIQDRVVVTFRLRDLDPAGAEVVAA